jgi:lipopolysaccharide export LptBFGC system permease protein LptF
MAAFRPLWRRHDGYVLRSFLAAFLVVACLLTALVVVADLGDRLDRIDKAEKMIRSAGETPVLAVLEYYATLLPFLWWRLLPLAALIAGAFSLTWLSRHNELAPLVVAGVPSRRIVLPILLAGVALAGTQVLVRETLSPRMSRRHEVLSRLLANRPPDRLGEVKHFDDPSGARLSMAAYLPQSLRVEDAFVHVRSDPATGGRRTLYRYPTLVWSAGTKAWLAERGGERIVLDPARPAGETRAIPAGERAPIDAPPSLLELTFREGSALGLSSSEIRELVDAYPGRPRLRLLLHEQRAVPVSLLVLLLVGLPFGVQLSRGGVIRRFLLCASLVALYEFLGSVATDLGARGELNPVVAAWSTNVVFGALGLVLFAGMET